MDESVRAIPNTPVDPLPSDERAGWALRESLLPRADGELYGAPVWHGWVIMDAFLAGAAHGRGSLLPEAPQPVPVLAVGEVPIVTPPSPEDRWTQPEQPETILSLSVADVVLGLVLTSALLAVLVWVTG